MYLFINIFNKDRGRSNTMEERKKTGKSYLWALFAFLLAVAADQFTKWLAVTYLKDQDPLIIIPGVFRFRYLENRGAAFGILQNRQIVFAVGALLIFFAVVFIYGRIPQKRRFVPLRVCAILLASGAIGNLIDRLARNYVVDFCYFNLIDFPIFNVADCYVVIGCILFGILILFYYKDQEFDWVLQKKGSRS